VFIWRGDATKIEVRGRGHDKRCGGLHARRLPSADVVTPPSQPTVGFSAHRLPKIVRTTCAPFIAVLGFSVLLTIVFVLYQPTRGPGDLQELGWQSWATVSPKPATNGDVVTNNTTTQGDQTGPGNVPPGTEWWDVEAPEPEVESSSLPLDVWDPLMPHDTGRTSVFPYRSQPRSCLVPYSGRNCDREVLHRPRVRSRDVRPKHGHSRRRYQGKVGSRWAGLEPRDFDDVPRGLTQSGPTDPPLIDFH
jgi:hypothetical protein